MRRLGIGCASLFAIVIVLGIISSATNGGNGRVSEESTLLAPGQGTATPVIGTATVTTVPPTRTSTIAPTATTAITSSPTPSLFTVANTGGEGVYLRKEPNASERIRAWPDGTTMIVVGVDRQVNGKTWKNVRDPAGNQGWLSVEYLTSGSAQSVSAIGPTATPKIAIPPGTVLALMDIRGETDSYGYSTVTGRVMNLSNRSLESVLAVAEWYTEDGTFVKRDEALIDYDPLLPEQVSPFEVLTRTNPAMKKYRIHFRHFGGAAIQTWDATDALE